MTFLQQGVFDTGFLGLQCDGEPLLNSLNSICTVPLPPVREQVRGRRGNKVKGEACDSTVLLSHWAVRKPLQTDEQKIVIEEKFPAVIIQRN